MSAIKFLQQKGIITGENTSSWMVKFDDGREFDIIQLMEEFGAQLTPDAIGDNVHSIRQLTPLERLVDLRRLSQRLKSDLMADDFTDTLHKIRSEVTKLLDKHPELNTKENLEYFGMA